MKNWRNKQLSSFGNNNILLQELVLIDFLKNSNSKNIKWLGDNNGLFELIKENYTITEIDEEADTCVIFGDILMNKTLNTVSFIIQKRLCIKNLYVGINRFTIEKNDYNLNLPDSLEETITEAILKCNQNFRRLANFESISGSNFVFAHPMDLYGLNQ